MVEGPYTPNFMAKFHGLSMRHTQLTGLIFSHHTCLSRYLFVLKFSYVGKVYRQHKMSNFTIMVTTKLFQIILQCLFAFSYWDHLHILVNLGYNWAALSWGSQNYAGFLFKQHSIFCDHQRKTLGWYCVAVICFFKYGFPWKLHVSTTQNNTVLLLSLLL